MPDVAALPLPRALIPKISRAMSWGYGLIMTDGRPAHRHTAAEDAPALSREERRDRKRHEHEAQKKAKEIDKSHDKDKTKSQDKKDKKGKDKKRK